MAPIAISSTTSARRKSAGARPSSVTRWVAGSATPAAAGVGPAAGTPTPAVDAAIGRAFGDDLDAAGKARLGTRGVVVLKGGAESSHRAGTLSL